MKKIRKIAKPILFSLCLIIFAFIVKLLLQDKLAGFDNKIYNLIIKIKCDPITYFFKGITTFCSMWFVGILTALIMLFSKDKQKAFYIALNVLLCFLLNQGLKYLFMRERPDLKMINVTGYSFPSGHSMLSVAFYGFIAYLALHSRRKRSKRLLMIIALILLTLLIGISRIYLGVHYASDVLAGFMISVAYLILFITFYNEKKRN